jgi:hypothetical protein
MATDPTDNKMKRKGSFDQLFANKFDNLGEVDKCLDRQKLAQSTEEK